MKGPQLTVSVVHHKGVWDSQVRVYHTLTIPLSTMFARGGSVMPYGPSPNCHQLAQNHVYVTQGIDIQGELSSVG